MNTQINSRNWRTLSLAGAVAAAMSAAPAMAQSSYYDPVRDVMVPRVQSHQSPYQNPQQGQQVIRVDPTGNAYAPSLPSTYALLIRNGQLVSGPNSITVEHGADVVMTIESQYDDSLRVDGYGLMVPLPAGQPVVLKFTAEQPGRFPYSLARSGQTLGVIEVGPARTISAR